MENTPEDNNADPRLAPAQAIVDAALQTARDGSGSRRMVNIIGESTRQLVADRIKTGGALDAETGRIAEQTAVPSQQRGRGR